MGINLEIDTSSSATAQSNLPRVEVTGKVSKKATYEILNLFLGKKEPWEILGVDDDELEMDYKTLCKMIQIHEEGIHGKQDQRASIAPYLCWLRDDPKLKRQHPISPHAEFNWEPVRVRVVPTNVQVLDSDNDTTHEEKKANDDDEDETMSRRVQSEVVAKFVKPNIVYKSGPSGKQNVKARITYKFILTGSVAAYYRGSRGDDCKKPYFNCNIQYILEQNDMKHTIDVTQDIVI